MTATVESALALHQSHMESVAPGLPARFTAACQPGDYLAQGDLNINVVADWPMGHMPVTSPTDMHRQLVPETGAGSHHRLESLDGVTLRYPPGWSVNANTDSLDGPSFRVSREVWVRHEPGTSTPHGPVLCIPGLTYHCTYQRTLIGEERREARARD